MAQRRTADKQQAFLKAIALGHSKRGAAAIAGISRDTPDDWEKKDSAFSTALRDAYDRAMAAQETKVVLAEDWRAAAHYLAVRERETWGKADKVEHSGGVEIIVTRRART